MQSPVGTAIAPFDFVLFRVPSLALKEFTEINRLLQSNGDDAGGIFRLALQTFPRFRQALCLASPVLGQRISEWLQGVTVSEEKELISSLYKYFSRICSRSTPYGLFAGVVPCIQSDSGDFLAPDASDRIMAELDIAYLREINRLIRSESALKQKLRYFTNNTVYRAGDYLRYLECVLHDDRPHTFLVSAPRSEVIDRILSMANEGCHYDEMKEYLCSLALTTEEADHFLEELIHSQLVLSELEPRVTGGYPLKELLGQISSSEESAPLVGVLQEISDLLYKKEISGDTPAEIADLLSRTGIGLPLTNLLHVLLRRGNIRVHCIKETIRGITTQLQELLVLNRSVKNPGLSRFKEAFYARYGEEEVPLAIALDSEMGIPYGSRQGVPDNPFIRNLVKETPPDPGAAAVAGEWEQFVLRKYLETASGIPGVLEITGADLSQFSPGSDLPPSFYALGNLLAPAEGNDSFLFHLHFLGGSSAVNLMSRFAASSEVLYEKLKEVVSEEEKLYPDAILAEIAHLPDTRAGIVAVHPPFRKHEIPYLAPSGVPQHCQLPIDDLMLSVRQGSEIILRSKKFNKRVIPRLSNAHNHTLGLPVYQFLCDLQGEDSALNLYWDWSFLADRPFLPRVTYKNIILKRATWNLTSGQIANPEGLRSGLGLPRYVQVIEGDNELLLDLDNRISNEILIKACAKTGTVQVTEFLQSPERAVAFEGNEGFCSEIIIPYRRVSDPPIVPPLPIPSRSNVQRQFLPGSEWLYVKIYCGRKFADTLLLTGLKPFADRLMDKQAIEKWFFIRYQDPDPHLRVRFYNSGDKHFYATVLSELNELLSVYTNSYFIEKVVVDTYKRELERYGPERIETVESIFCGDSRMALSFMELLRSEDLDSYRWLLALRATDVLLDAFGLDLEEKARFAEVMYLYYFEEHGKSRDLKKQLNDQYRSLRDTIRRFFSQGVILDICMADALQVLEAHAAGIREQVQNAPGRFDSDQVAAIIHMFFNRFFNESQRTFELVNYHFISRYYRELLARQKL